jgi:hypothetical protein
MVECLLRGLVADDACYLAYLTQRRVGVRLVPGTTVVVGCLVFCSGPPGLPNPHYFNFSGTFRIPIGDMPISLHQQEIRPIFDACCKDPLLSL